MNVAQLIEELQKMPSHLPVVAMANGEIKSERDPYFALEVRLERIATNEEGRSGGPGPVVAIDFNRAPIGAWPSKYRWRRTR